MNPIFIKLGFIEIYWYSFFIFIGLLIGALLALKESKKWKIPEKIMVDYFFYLIPIVLVGARIYYVLFNLDYYGNNIINILKVWEGGLAIHGGIIAGILWTLYYMNKNKIKFLKITDIMVVSLILGQAIGRWGNFMNQEAYGPITTLKHLQNLHIPKFIIDNMYIDGNYHEPTFLYESIFCLIGFIILLIIRSFKKTKNGQITGFYFIWYGIIRFFIESLRTDSLMLGNLKMAQLVSIIMIIIGIVLIIYKALKSNDLYNSNEDYSYLNEKEKVKTK